MEGGFRRRPSEENVRAAGLPREMSAEYLELSATESQHKSGILVRTLSRVLLSSETPGPLGHEAAALIDASDAGRILATRIAAASLGLLLLGLAVWRRWLALVWAALCLMASRLICSMS